MRAEIRTSLKVFGDLPHSATDNSGSVCKGAMQAMDIVGVGALIIDADRRIHGQNRLAQGSLASWALWVDGERLSTTNEVDDYRLGEAVRRVGARCDTAERLPLRVGAALTRTLLIASLDAGATASKMAMIALQESDGGHSDGLTSVFTPAETKLLRALVVGERLSAYAERTGVKITTVKTHLQGLFDKVGERRQSDLIRRALSDPLLRRHL